MLRTLYLVTIIFVFFSCKDDDVFLDCCWEVDADLEQFFYAPNLYTPDGYGPAMDEKFTVIPRSLDTLDNPAITSAFNFKAYQPDGTLFYSQDTIYVYRNNPNQYPPAWDFINAQGEKAKGSYKVEFDFTDLAGSVHHAAYTICVVTCQDVEDLNLKLDRTKCRTADQIDPRKGFVHQSSESSCYFK